MRTSFCNLGGSACDVLTKAPALIVLACLAGLALGEESPVGLWRFDEEGGAELVDGAGEAHGWLAGGEDAPTRIGGALFFDGLGDAATFPAARVFDLDGFWTFSAWVYPRETPDDAATILVRPSAWSFRIDREGRFRVALFRVIDEQVKSWRSIELAGASPLPIDKWTHVAASYDGEKLSLYVGGAFTRHVTLPGVAQTDSGGEPCLGYEIGRGYPFTGLIDDLALYDRALSPKEIGALARSDAPPSIVKEDLPKPAPEVAERPKRAPAQARPGNHLGNASFECGAYGWFGPDDVTAAPAIVKAGAHADHAMRLTAVRPAVTGPYVWLDETIPHTASVAARGSEGAELELAVYSSFRAGRRSGRGKAVSVMREIFPLTAEWARYSLGGVLPYSQNGHYRIAMRVTGGEALIDCVQLEEGRLRPFGPGARAEAGVQIEGPRHHIFSLGAPVKAYWTTFIEQDARDIDVRWRVVDYDDDIVVTGKLAAETGRTQGSIKFSTGQTGIFRIIVCARTSRMGRIFEAEDVFAVIKPPKVEAVPAEQSRFATHVAHPRLPDGALSTEFIEIARLLGVRWNRLHGRGGRSTRWTSVERKRGEFRLDDEEVKLFADNGFKLVGSLEGMPAWTGADGGAANAPGYLADWNTYVTRTVTFFKDQVDCWEVVGASSPHRSATSAPAQYVSLLAGARRIVKRVHAEATLLGASAGATPEEADSFLNAILAAGALEHIDVLSYQASLPSRYATLPDEFEAHPWDEVIAGCRALMKRYGDERPIEYASVAVRSRPFRRTFRVTDSPSARLLPPVDYREAVNDFVRSHVVSFAAGVERVTTSFIGADEPGVDDPTGPAMIGRDGVPKPHLVAYPTMIDLLDGRDFVDKRTLGERTTAYVFHGRLRAIAVIWTRFARDRDDGTLSFVSPVAGEIRSVMGRRMDAFSKDDPVTCPIGREPRYIVFWSPSEPALSALVGAAIEEPERVVKTLGRDGRAGGRGSGSF